MKKLYTILFLSVLCFGLQAQLDTVLFEDFQVNPFETMADMASGSDTDWVNFDADGLETAFGTEESKKWFWSEFFYEPVDPTTGETNYIGSSLSFLVNFLPGNRNWLVLPPIEITDDSYMLHWESAPNQLPRYMDGYVVLVSTGSNHTDANTFTDTLFLAASMLEIVGDGNSTDYSNFTFTPGYLHADGGTNTDYFHDGGNTVFNGLLEPHSVSLADYIGETIYITFLHNSDDDERLGLDDILITKASSSNTNDVAIQALRMECYPNPAMHKMNLNFKLKGKTSVEVQILNTSGQILQNQRLGNLSVGEHQTQLRLDQLAPGTYLVSLKAGKVIATQAFVKK